MNGKDNIVTDKYEQRVDLQPLGLDRRRWQHNTEFRVVILIRRIKPGGQFRDRNLGKTGDLGYLVNFLVVIFGAAIDPGDRCSADRRKIFFQGAIDQAFDPPVRIQDDTEAQGIGPFIGDV